MKWPCLVLCVLLFAADATAQTNCNEGGGLLNAAQPSNVGPAEIIQKFVENESRFERAQANYMYTRDVVIQTISGRNFVTGEYQQVASISFDSRGNRVETITFSPESSLREVTITREDIADLRALSGGLFTPDELPEYNVRYAGQQHVDELDTYVFDISPKHMNSNRRYFEGRAWVDVQDLAVVKTCGKFASDRHDKQNLSPKFVIYRELIDGQYWLPTFARADDVLRFRRYEVHIRETIKFTNYRRGASAGAAGNTGQNAGKEPGAPPAKKP